MWPLGMIHRGWDSKIDLKKSMKILKESHVSLKIKHNGSHVCMQKQERQKGAGRAIFGQLRSGSFSTLVASILFNSEGVDCCFDQGHGCMSTGLLLWSRKPIDLKRNFAHFVHLFLDFAFSFPTNGANSIANVGDLCPNET